MTEILVLKFFLFAAVVLAPLVTKTFFLRSSPAYSNGHKIFLLILLCGSLLDLKHLAVIWPLFCVWGFLLYLKNEYKSILSAEGAATCIPFTFSVISSVWFVAGAYDLHLLGYNQTWSFYAALHGAFLGWILIGCLAFLGKRENSNRLYRIGSYLSLLFFLCVALGINGIPYIKRIGVIGLSLIAPLSIGYYAFNLKREEKLSILLAVLSLFSLSLSMTLAVLNEFWVGFPKIAVGMPTMLLAHGSLNALLAIPCFFLAIKLERGSR